jgi:hypothetical protein
VRQSRVVDDRKQRNFGQKWDAPCSSFVYRLPSSTYILAQCSFEEVWSSGPMKEAMISGSVDIILDRLLMAKLGFSWIHGILPPMDYLTVR